MPKSLFKVKTSEIHGRGLYAKVDIDEETQIIQYVGEKITKKESKKRALAWEEEARKTGEGLVYIFELDDKYDIDGRVGDNPARYMNHSCDGNCEAINFDGEIWIVAIQDIKKAMSSSTITATTWSIFLTTLASVAPVSASATIVREDQRSKVKKLLKGRKKKRGKKNKKWSATQSTS